VTGGAVQLQACCDNRQTELLSLIAGIAGGPKTRRVSLSILVRGAPEAMVPAVEAVQQEEPAWCRCRPLHLL
jgi:hypothetical protein